MKHGRCTRLRTRLAPDSLRIQLLSRSLFILAVLLILVGLLQYIFMRDVVYQSKALSLESQVQAIPPPAWQQFNRDENNRFKRPSGPLTSSPTKGFNGNKEDDLAPIPRVFMPEVSLAFIDLKGNYTDLSNELYSISPPRLDKQVYLDKLQLTDRRGPLYQLSDAGGEEQIIVLQPVFLGPGEKLGLVQIGTLTAPLQELLFRQLLTFLCLALLALLVGLLAYLSILKRTLVPLSNMVDTAEQIDAGNLDRRFPVQQGQAEIDRLAESCNGMLERLELSFAAEKESQEQMRRFIADASHELRTPLTSIHGFLEVLLRGAANQPEQLDKSLKSMYSESQRLNKLVHDLLLLSRLDRTPVIEVAEGYLDRVVRDMEPQFSILAGKRELSLNIEPDIKCKYDSDQIKQVILNLFQNAVQHTDPDRGKIQIALRKDNHGVLLSVKDNGAGINTSHIPHIFDRFYRSDTSRTRKYGGSGLGLAISKSIVDVHGGKISVVSQEGEGTLFQVWLPE